MAANYTVHRDGVATISGGMLIPVDIGIPKYDECNGLDDVFEKGSIKCYEEPQRLRDHILEAKYLMLIQSLCLTRDIRNGTNLGAMCLAHAMNDLCFGDIDVQKTYEQLAKDAFDYVERKYAELTRK